MNTSATHSVSKKTEDIPRDNREKRIIFWETVNIVFKTTGVISWFCILLLTVLEIKRYFNIDVIPGYNSAVDDVYNAVRAVIF